MAFGVAFPSEWNSELVQSAYPPLYYLFIASFPALTSHPKRAQLATGAGRVHRLVGSARAGWSKSRDGLGRGRRSLARDLYSHFAHTTFLSPNSLLLSLSPPFSYSGSSGSRNHGSNLISSVYLTMWPTTIFALVSSLMVSPTAPLSRTLLT